MTEREFEDVFTRFLNGYWGAFHELLEAESVKPERLATSLVQKVVNEHAWFATVCPGEAKEAVEVLGQLWRQFGEHRERVPDDPLGATQVRQALSRFGAIYDALFTLGQPYSAVRARVVERATHATPRAPLRADAAS